MEDWGAGVEDWRAGVEDWGVSMEGGAEARGGCAEGGAREVAVREAGRVCRSLGISLTRRN